MPYSSIYKPTIYSIMRICVLTLNLIEELSDYPSNTAPLRDPMNVIRMLFLAFQFPYLHLKYMLIMRRCENQKVECFMNRKELYRRTYNLQKCDADGWFSTRCDHSWKSNLTIPTKKLKLSYRHNKNGKLSEQIVRWCYFMMLYPSKYISTSNGNQYIDSKHR